MSLENLFKTRKPVIGMLHLMPFPTDPKYGDPRYHSKGTMEQVIETARKDLHALQDGGVDAILFCNEFSIPYSKEVEPAVLAAYARTIGELRKEITLPYGVDLALDPYKTYDLAAATDAQFVRETFMGAYAGTYGIRDYDIGKIERHRKYVGGNDLYGLTTLIPEGSTSLSALSLEAAAKSFEKVGVPDALLIYGVTAGSEVDLSLIPAAKKVLNTPIYVSNGVSEDNIEEILETADGCIVGTWFKYDGEFYQQVDPSRVERLMEKAKKVRKKVYVV